MCLDLNHFLSRWRHDIPLIPPPLLTSMNMNNTMSKKSLVGRASRHTVYESECIGQILALKMLQKLGQDLVRKDIIVAMDNQASLRAYSVRKPTPGGYLIEDARTLFNAITKKWPRVRLKLQWVPGHEGIEGNEKADMEAKRVTEGEHCNRRNEHHHLIKVLPASKSATKQHLKKKVQKEHEKEF